MFLSTELLLNINLKTTHTTTATTITTTTVSGSVTSMIATSAASSTTWIPFLSAKTFFSTTTITQQIALSLRQVVTSAGVNFTNVLRAAFMLADHKSAKKDSQVVSLFWAFGICAVKSWS
jgi:hypothetical protein